MIPISQRSPDQPELQQRQNVSIDRYLKRIKVIALIVAAIICGGVIVSLALEFAAVKYFYNVSETERAKLEQPRLRDHGVLYWKIERNEKEDRGKVNCALINSGNLVTDRTLNTVIRLLESKTLSAVYIITDSHDLRAKILIKKKLSQFIITSEPIQFSFDFPFGQEIRQECSKLAYLFSNFQIDNEMVIKIGLQIERLEPSSLYFTFNFQRKNQIVKAADLRKQDLSLMDPIELYSYLYIFDPEFISLFAPINFLYYAKYTFQQIMLIPALVFYQSLSKMKTNNEILHRVDLSLVQFKQFTMDPPQRSQKSLCFVSYPSDPFKIDSDNAIQYLKSIQNQNLMAGDEFQPIIVVYLPYVLQDLKGISSVSLKLHQLRKENPLIRMKLKVMANKISPSHAAYQSAYSFCPNRTLIIASRHNIRFHSKMAKEVLSWSSTRYHYYFFNFEDQNGKRYDLNGLDYQYEFISKKGSIIQDKLRHVQVFRSQLMKLVPFWILKSAQIDFYETQAPFITNMAQIVRNFGIKCIEEVLATVLDRPMSQTERKQIENIRPYTIYSPLYINILMPIPFNCLENPVFRRNAPFKIPPLIHQIWISKTEEISGVRKALHETLIKANPNFKMILWRNQNLTASNFPLTYNLITAIVEKNKESKRSLFVMAADLMRYEILLHHGGIYLDFKLQGNKPLDNFLKYESFYNDLQSQFIRFGRPKAIGNGFMGATPNNYHLRMLLTQILNQHTFYFGKIVPYITGGWVLRNALSDYEIYTQLGMEYHLIIPVAYENAEDYCGGANQDHYDADQIVYEIKRGGKVFRYPVPCKRYPESYGVMFSPLAGTWVTQNAQIN